MSDELTDLNQQANCMADLLEAVARKLRTEETWPMALDEVGNLLVPVEGRPAIPGPANVSTLVMRRNALLETPLTTAA